MRRPLLLVFAVSLLGGSASGVASGLLIKQTINSGSAAQQHRLYLAQVSGCRRQNIRTAATNKNALATWRYDTFFADALTIPQPNQTAQQRAVLPGFRAHLLDATTTLTWTPLNHRCAKEPTAVQLPVSFETRRRGHKPWLRIPGKADLTVP